MSEAPAGSVVESTLEIARTAEAAGDYDRAVGYWRALAQMQPKNARWAFEEARVLRDAGRLPEAGKALTAALQRFPRARQSEEIRAILPELKPTVGRAIQTLGDDCPADDELKRPAIEDEDPAVDCIVARGGRKTAVVVFTGLADRMVMPLPAFDRFFAALDLTAVYLRDRRRYGYFGGVESLGRDYDETLAALRQKLDGLGVETVHTVGNSAGGIGAVSYGLDLGARTVLGFSAPVALTRAAAETDRRTPRFAERLLSDAVPAERRDLLARARAAPDTAIHLFFGSEMPEDEYHARWLGEAPNVTLHPLPGLAGHGALFQVSRAKGLRPLFQEMFGAAD